MEIENYSLEELKNEINRREREKENQTPRLNDLTIIAEKATNDTVIIFMHENIESIAKNGHPLPNFKLYCFEQMIDIYYGNIWEWYIDHNKGE